MVLSPVNSAASVDEDELRRLGDALGCLGLRSTASAAHARAIEFVEAELRAIAGLTLRSEDVTVRRWRPVPEGDLERAGALRVAGAAVAVAGAVPYSQPGHGAGPLVYLPPGERITAENAAGRVVLREFPQNPPPFALLTSGALHLTPDVTEGDGARYDRPAFADDYLHADLLDAGRAGAAGLVIAFDLPREQVAGYFEPHKGTHYAVPAVFVGVDEAESVRAATGAQATVTVRAVVDDAVTRNVIATLPGRTDERIVLLTHTDGNTWMQENGPAALIALARYFAALPLEARNRTLEFAFTAGHLHISREGTREYARRLDEEFDDSSVACVVAVEHLGTRGVEAVPRTDGPGRSLVFGDTAEVMLWAVGPSEAMRRVVVDAVGARGLDRVIVSPGLGRSPDGHLPEYGSFGGIGTYSHLQLVPTTAVISGPWSLWAPSFGADAVDVTRLRAQVLAIGDVVAALDGLPRTEIAGDYLVQRAARAAGAVTWPEDTPAECG